MSTFADVLGSLEGGVTFEQLNDHLSDVVIAVLKHRKVGEISISIKISANGENAVNIVPTLKVKAPEASRATSAFYADEHGNLLRRDPKQREMTFREVADDKPKEFRTAQ